jgi:16S rRNA (guanine966-N2)-methyltransferase|tara:strand:+ start:352 stop:912 length:561 start_codon:yes stop_codon:yes gene_type:complete
MRIIGGDLKGKKILFSDSKKTRPLRDLVKESIFNIINHSKLINVELPSSHVLDLYSGIGSFGLECISQKAKKVVFVEEDRQALLILDKNLTNLSVQDKNQVFDGKVEDYLNQNIVSKFNIFFFDPPFADINYLNNIKKIKEIGIYTKNNLVIVHREKKSLENYDKIFKTISTKNYGRSKIIFGIFI